MGFLERHALVETCESKLADYGVETMQDLKSLSLEKLESRVHLKPMHAERVIDALAADAKAKADAEAGVARAEADAAAAAAAAAKVKAKAEAEAKAKAQAQQAKAKQEAEAQRQREADAEAARQREADATAAAAAAAAAAEPQLSQAEKNEKVFEFCCSGDVKKLIQALKAGGTPDGHKVRE